MKWSVQPATFKDPISEIEVVVQENDTSPDISITNQNPLIPICTYPGQTESLDPEECDLFHFAFTDEGMGFTFNG